MVQFLKWVTRFQVFSPFRAQSRNIFSIKMFRDRARKELLALCPKYFLKFYFKNGFRHDPENSFSGTIPKHFFNHNVSGSCPNKTFWIMPKEFLIFYFKNDFGHDPKSSFLGTIPKHFSID